MADKSGIQWTDSTWNPIVGCSIVSPGCTNCYAMKMASRIESMNAGLKPGHGSATHYTGTTKKVNDRAIWTGKVAMAPEAILTVPLKWKRPRKIFVNSMGDLHHEKIKFGDIDKVVRIMAKTPQHTYQLLTKRAAGMHAYWSDPELEERIGAQMPLPNVWLGVSAERQEEADERIPLLLSTPAAIRFISAEPLLGPIDFNAIRFPDRTPRGHITSAITYDDEEPRIDWVIVGGESGPGARPMHIDWARHIIDDCNLAGVAVFMKQLGAKPQFNLNTADGEYIKTIDLKLADRTGGDWQEWSGPLRHRQFPETKPPAATEGRAGGTMLRG